MSSVDGAITTVGSATQDGKGRILTHNEGDTNRVLSRAAIEDCCPDDSSDGESHNVRIVSPRCRFHMICTKNEIVFRRRSV